MNNRAHIIISLIIASMVVFGAATSASGKTIYVDDDAAGANDGTSWENAYIYLQDALADANSAEKPVEIRVAQGIYKPDQGANQISGDRSASFRLLDGVTLKGGFGETDPNARDIDLYETILSGDLLGNDIDDPIAKNDPFGRFWDEPPFDENSSRVVTSREDNPTAVLDGFTITGSSSRGLDNGGIFASGSSITVLNCTFTRNVGGMSNSQADPTLINCKFNGNYAGDGGGMYSRGNPTLINCTFSDNFAIFHGTLTSVGGGIASYGNPTLINCVFFRNQARSNGGAIYNSGNPTLINCTFTANEVQESWRSDGDVGGAIYSSEGIVTITSCILWGDSPSEISQDSVEDLFLISYSNIQGGWPDNQDRRGIIDTDPLFMDRFGHDSIPGTEYYDLRLSPLSSCIDAGDPSYVAGPNETDLAGKPRLRYGRIDMGAYESQADFALSTSMVTVPEAETATFTVRPARDPLEAIEVTVVHLSGDADITVESGALLTFDSSNYTQPQSVTLAAAEDGDYLKGIALIQISASGLAHAEVIVSEWDNDAPPLYVDVDALGADNGLSWADAFVNLQDALRLARMSPHIVEIRVAQGTYRPDRGVDQTPGDRNALFQLIDGVALMGSYAGFGEPDPNARNIEQYETILSADLNGDDEGTLTFTWAENAYQVVEATYVDDVTVLDGFTITSGGILSDIGGGMSNKYASPTINNCTFRDNYATVSEGGGMYNYRSNPTLTNCTFSANAAREGGGMANRWSSPKLINCTFRGNHATHDGGGGMVNYGSNPTLINCTLSGNHATDNEGGGMANYLSNSKLINCIFSGNHAERHGGGIINRRSNSTLNNCTFSNNYARRGSVITNEDDSNLILINCTISRNVCRITGGEAIQNGPESYLELTNCIVWGNIGARYPIDADTTVSYSNVQDGFPGRGNINNDPLFADPLGPDNIAGTEDDDLRLAPLSPCIDAGDPAYESGLNETDLAGKPRLRKGNPLLRFRLIDMGAYEFQNIIYVDDDAPDDPGPGDILVSDPLENGTEPRPMDTIQEAIDIAKDGYTVLVNGGVYREPIDFKGKKITVSSGSDVAVLETPGDYAVSFYSAEGPDSILKNFVIRNSLAGVFIPGSSPTIRNLTVVDNEYGITAYTWAEPDISNCIFWNNSEADLFQCEARYSCIEDGGQGIGNINTDPLFIDAANGDYHLRSEGWCWNTMTQSWTYDYVTSPCIDAGDPACPLSDEPMRVPRDPDNIYGENQRINMGAYGGTSQASMPPVGWTPP